MSRNHIFMGMSLLVLVSCTSTMTPRTNTRDALVGYVGAAADLVARNGPSCDTFKQPAWMSGDYYIFVIGPDGRTLCHASADLIGRPVSEIVDANGMRPGDAILAAGASAEGSGWVEYVWPRPGTTTPVAKSTYVKRVTGADGQVYIVGSGAYNL